MGILIGVGVAFVLAIIILLLYNHCERIKLLDVKYNESLDNIKMIIEKEIELLEKTAEILNKNNKDKIMTDIDRIKKNNLNIFESDILINKLLKEYKDILVINNKAKYNKEDLDVFNRLNDNTIEFKALKNYYNVTAEKYNSLIKSMLFKLIKIIKRYKQKDLFIIEKEVDFEILKD